MKEFLKIPKPLEALVKVLEPKGQRLALLEGPSGCNRSCSYCAVPQRWDAEKASTLDQTRSQIDWLYKQGFRVLQYVGGEPLTPFFKTKEGLTFQQHTLEVVTYASRKKGMLVNVTTNGDYVDESVLKKLKEAGIDTLTFSLHSVNKPGIRKIITGARMAAEAKIPPIISVVFTSDRTETIPEIAERCAENGIIFATTVVQEYGGGFSAVPVESKIPTIEQQREVFQRLKKLKRAGFIRNNINYLEHATDFPNNSWKCDPDKDSFISVRGEGQGKISVCSEVHTEFEVGEVNLKDNEWRKEKQDLVHNCNNCLYSCAFESQNPNLKGDLPTLAMMGLIKSGHAGLVERLGQRAVGKEKFPQPEEHVLQPGVSVNLADIKKSWKWDNVSKGHLFAIRVFSSSLTITMGVFSTGFVYVNHSLGRVSMPLDIVGSLPVVISIPASVVVYETFKRRWRDEFAYDMMTKNKKLSSQKTSQLNEGTS